jgi:hypothetical protein
VASTWRLQCRLWRVTLWTLSSKSPPSSASASQSCYIPLLALAAYLYLNSFCRYIDAETLGRFSQRILSDLVPFLAQASENSLALVMETIRAVIGVDASILNAEATSQLVNVIFQVWQAHPEGSFIVIASLHMI